MDIKKIDDKPMVIHTKQKSKLHLHNKKEGTIQGHNIYTRKKVEPTSSSADMISEKNKIKPARRNFIRERYDEGGKSIKIRDRSLHIRGTGNLSSIKGAGELGANMMADQVEGGNEIRDAAYIAETMMSPAVDTAKNVARTGNDISRKLVDKTRQELRRKKIKKLDIHKKLAKHRIKRLAKSSAKKIGKDTAKEAGKETAKEAAKITTEITAETAVTVGTEVGAAAAGTAVGPEGTIIGWAAGKAIGEEVGNRIEIEDAKATNRLRKIRWFIDKTKAQDEQKDSLAKMIRDILIRDLITQLRVRKSLFLTGGATMLILVLMVVGPIAATLGVIYNSPLAIFFPSPENEYDDIRTVLSSYYMDFNKSIIEKEESGDTITYQNTENGAPVSNFNDTLVVYMTLYSDGEAGYIMDDEGKKNLKKIFDEMNYVDDSSTTVEKQVGESLGKLWVTGYCPCSICCGPYANGITASGKVATAKHTIAVDAYNPVVPMGTKVVIEETEYTVEDTGDLNHYGNDIDIYFANHSDALQWGRQNVEVYISEGNENTVKVTTSGTTVHNLTYKDYMDTHELNEDQKKMLADMMDSDLWNEYYSGAAGSAVATLALTKVGCKYDQARRMEEGYYDCSSLVYRLYKEVGIELPTVADTQGKYCYENAMIINQSELMPGDLIFYSYEENGCFRNISHVAIYVGNGTMVHAAGKSRGVVLDPLRTNKVVFYARPYK